jgi:hypothetical protein
MTLYSLKGLGRGLYVVSNEMRGCPCTVSGDFILMLQDLIYEVVPSQKCHMNIGPVLNGYGATDI